MACAGGDWITSTTTERSEIQFGPVIRTVYSPDAESEVAMRIGFFKVEVKKLGPTHWYVVCCSSKFVNISIVSPWQTGLLLLTDAWQGIQLAGAVKDPVPVHDTAAEKAADIVVLVPFEGKFEKEKGIGFANGALNC